ncbi:hypothetical protein [Sediminispirochaeta smaragdinae]|uniref:Uncharacterized protein n=1 Tax=Sediminispirochaeta smaragdinae (strain DSM 11293 / JCM 15392 / SEBR 4228) TaxID=573413 RepID=E1R206_SEDSS|nr:hypothetical protein [Sediminispirochaeta smaragdinae]ADK81891.1 hypothetical protein Spirs_2788 [Sediminispirochaeta smaragdinae DSM 11293]
MNITDITVDDIIEEQETAEETGLEKLKGDIDEVISRMEALSIQSDEQLAEAGEWLVKNKQTQKIVKDHFEPERKETYAAYKAVTDQIKKYTDILTKAERTVKKKMGAYQAEQDRLRIEAAEKQRKEAEKEREQSRKDGNSAPVIPLPPEKKEEPVKIEGVSFSENWTFIIEETDKIPREYMVPDEKKIRQVVKALKADTNIPGIKVYAEKTVSART